MEHPGAWAADALNSRGLPEPVRDHLDSLWPRWRIRVLLVRRRRPAAGSGVTVFAASTAAGGEWIERTKLADPRELVDIDLSPLRRERSVGLDPHHDPLFLVCTHGSHDTCCGLFGRPVADALGEWWPVETWECSHVGGDRFAGNVVSLPVGVYFGRLDPDTAPTVIAGLLDGRVDLGHYRGRTCFPFAVQAAETWVRRHLRLDGIDEVRPIDWSGDTVRFTVAGGEERSVRVHVTTADEPRYLTCAEVGMVRPPTFEVAWAG